MSFLRYLRGFILIVAVAAYAVNGMKAHISFSEDGTILIPVCTVQGTTYLTVNLGGDDPVEETDTSCGLCMVGQGVETDTPYFTPPIVLREFVSAALPSLSLPHRSPIWPGAPPIGPPTA